MTKAASVFIPSALFVLMSASGALAAACADFGTADADGSGDVSFSEASGAIPGLSRSDFEAHDADGSGGLDRSEYSRLVSAKCEDDSWNDA